MSLPLIIDNARSTGMSTTPRGGSVQSRSFEVLKSGGVLVSSVSPPDSTEAARRSVRAEFILVDVSSAALAQITDRIDAGMLNTHVGSVLPLAEARRAHEMLAGKVAREPGRIVLTTAGMP